MSGNNPNSGTDSGVSRRTFVKAAGASGVAVTLAGCSQDGNGNGGGNGNGNGGGNGNGNGGGNGGSGTTTVRFGFDPVAAENNGDEIKQSLHDNGLSDDIEVQFVPGNQDTGARRDSYTQLLRAGEAQPDMFLMDNGWVNIFIQNGYLANLSDILSDDVISTVNDEYFEGFTATARDPSSGDLYGVPVFPDFPTMQYRKDLVEEAGYDPEGENWATEPMSWERWSNITKDVVDQNSDVDHGFTTQWDIYEGTSCCTFNEVMSTWGGAYFGDPSQNLFGPVGDRPITVDEQQVVDSLNMMRKFVHGEEFDKFSDYAGNIAPTAITSWTEEDARAPFAQGNAIMHRNWPYSIALTGRSPDDVEEGTPVLGTDKLGAMPIPYGVTEDEAPYPRTGGTVSALGGWHATVNPNSEKHDAVAQVIEAMQADDFQLTLLSAQGWLPPKPALFESDEARSVDIVGNYMDTLRVAGENVLARPVTSVWTQESSAIAQKANDAVAQASTSRAAMDSLKTQLEEIESA